MNRRRIGVLPRRAARARMRRRWLARFGQTSWDATERRLFDRLLELIVALLERRHAVARRASAEHRRIADELVPQYLAASKAWQDEGGPQGSEAHVAYARAQSWLAWACIEREHDAFVGLDRAIYAFHRAWRATLEAEGIVPGAP